MNTIKEVTQLVDVLKQAIASGRSHTFVKWEEYADSRQLAASRVYNAAKQLDGVKVHVHGTADGLPTLSIGIAVDKPLAVRKLRKQEQDWASVSGGTSPIICPKRGCLYDLEPTAHYRPVRHNNELALHKIILVECARHGVLAKVHSERELAEWLIDNTDQVDLWN